jgi:hypothetical protein
VTYAFTEPARDMLGECVACPMPAAEIVDRSPLCAKCAEEAKRLRRKELAR